MNFYNYLVLIILYFQPTYANPSLQCGEWDAFKDEKCYKVFDNKELQNYSDAKNMCIQNEASSLVAIKSQEEQDFLFSLLRDVHSIVNDVWIGAEYKENNLKWLSNMTINYTNWANGYPVNEREYECVNMVLEEPLHGKWHNALCNKKNMVVCEKSQNWLISYLQTTVMELRKSLDNMTILLETTHMSLSKTETEMNSMKTQTIKLENELKIAKTDLENMAKKSEITSKSLNLTETELKNTKSQLNSTNTDLEKTNSDLKNTNLEMNTVKAKLENNRLDLDQTKSYLQDEINKNTAKTTPPGTIAYFANTNPPLGWLKANGQSVSRTTYENLFATIGTRFGSGDGSTTFTLPDLRGEFIRGWSDGRDVDKSRTFGSLQLGSSIPFVDGINNDAIYAMGTGALGPWLSSVGTTFDDGYSWVLSGQNRSGITFPTGSSVNFANAFNKGIITAWNIFSGTRPRNIALLACIKY